MNALAAAAAVGLSRDAKHVYRWNGGDPLPSVTTIIKALDKSGPLIGWATRTTAEFAVRKAALISDMERAGGFLPTAKWVAEQARQERDAAAKLGTEIHFLCDAIARGEMVEGSETEKPYLDGFRRFLADRKPKVVATEELVANLTLGYAGTFDLVAEMDGKRWLLDIKTGKGIYAETGLQLAAYAKAEFIGKPNDPTQYPMPKCSRFGVVHLQPSGYAFVPYAVTAETWAAFRAAHVLHLWLNGEARTILEVGT